MIPEDEEEEDFGGVNEVYNVLYARNKLKRCRKRRNIFIVSIVAAVLVITIIVFAVLYRQELGKSISGTAVTDIRRAKEEEYKVIAENDDEANDDRAKDDEDCRSATSKDRRKCGTNVVPKKKEDVNKETVKSKDEDVDRGSDDEKCRSATSKNHKKCETNMVPGTEGVHIVETKVDKDVNGRKEDANKETIEDVDRAKDSEDCPSALSKNHRKCGGNSRCRYLHGTYRCDCKGGFAEDSKGDCRNVKFAIHFRTATKKNIPEVSAINFPGTDELSVCFWYKLAEFYGTKWHSIFMYESVDKKNSNELMMWLNANDEIHVSMRDTHQRVLQRKLRLNVWTHLCWTWNSTGQWNIYMSGLKVNMGNEAKKVTHRGKFPESYGSLILGQDKDGGKVSDQNQMFRGEITQFYLYHKQLTDEQVRSAYENKPSTQKIVVGWWQFEKTTSGTDIVESKYPFTVV